MAETMPPEVAPEVEENNERGLSVLISHVKEWGTAFAKKHAVLFTIILIVTLVVAFALRAPLHHYVIAVRRRLFLVALGGPFVWFVNKLFKNGNLRRRVVIGLFLLVFIPTMAEWGDNMHEYLSLYVRYVTLPKQELEVLPVTDHERTHPLHSIYNYARRAVDENNQPTLPRVVRNHTGQYEWTSAVEPAQAKDRLFGSVKEILAVSATTPSPRFLPENSHLVNFHTGVNMVLGSNTYSAVVKAFGPWRYLNDEPSDVIYQEDDDGEYVQVVSLIRWHGLFFPRREFGGVQVIRQQHATSMLGSDAAFIKKMLFGVGTYVAPQDIPKYPFLMGQNIVPHEVMRYGAESFRFQRGFMAPMPLNHDGDIRIPDLVADQNPQPFVVFFNVPGAAKLYGFFALEPYTQSQLAVHVMLLFPGDGQGPVYYYYPSRHNIRVTGPSGVPALIRDSRKQYTWQLADPAESRPYIKLIDGQIRFAWLSTVVIESNEGIKGTGRPESERQKDFVSGSTPEIVLTDAVYSYPVWMSSIDPSTWTEEFREKMDPTWKKDSKKRD